MRLLVIEDNPKMAGFIRQGFSEQGHAVDVADRGHDGEQMAASEPYDVIILDCPPSMGVITQNALIAADLLVIPTQAEYLSAYALRHVMSTIRAVRQEDNPNLMYRILITMLDKRIGSHKALSAQLHEAFGNAVFDTIIQVDSKLRESTIAGLPITHYVPRSRSALQYRALAQELCLIMEGTYVTRHVTGNKRTIDVARRIASLLIASHCPET